MIFVNLLSLEVFQSTPILGHAQVLHNAVLNEEESNIKILIIHLFTCWIYSSHLSPILMGNFIFPDINWEYYTEDSNRSRRFLSVLKITSWHK